MAAKARRIDEIPRLLLARPHDLLRVVQRRIVQTAGVEEDELRESGRMSKERRVARHPFNPATKLRAF